MRTDRKLCCLKTVLSIFLCILWLVGAAIFGDVLWLRLVFWTNEYQELNPKFEHYNILIYAALVTGAAVAVFSILGLIGGCLKIKWLLAVYLGIIVLTILLTASAVVYGTLYRSELKTVLVNDSLLNNIIESRYRNDHGHHVSHIVDIMQSQLECCGARGPLDYVQSKWEQIILSEPSSDMNRANLVPVPATCCKDYLHYQNYSRICYVREPGKDNITSLLIWSTGCEESLQQFLDKYVLVGTISIAAGFFILQVICMIICSMYIRLLNMYVSQPDDIVYDMAHNQEKSPYPSRGDYREYYN